MLNQLIKVLTPELIIQGIKDNPDLVLKVAAKMDTFRLLGAALTEQQQIILSNNIPKLNPFLASEEGRAAASLWAEEFTAFVNKLAVPNTEVSQLEARLRVEIEAKVRKELALSAGTVAPT